MGWLPNHRKVIKPYRSSIPSLFPSFNIDAVQPRFADAIQDNDAPDMIGGKDVALPIDVEDYSDCDGWCGCFDFGST
jgi:hypothetical protein